MEKSTICKAIGYADDRFLNMAENAAAEKSVREKTVSFRRLPAVVAAVLLVAACTVSAFAAGLFSPIDGDMFTMASSYEGGGRVAVVIENLSDRDLRLSPELKLMKYYANEEVPAVGEVSFSSTLVKAGETSSIEIDLSNAYDVEALERPLKDDWYYLLLTNNSFLFGHDWQCSVVFAENEPKTPEYTERITGLPANEGPGALDELTAFFDDYYIDPAERNENVAGYYAEVSGLLAELRAQGVNVVSPSAPALFVGRPPEGVTLDERVPADMQYQLILENHSALDAYNIPVGASEADKCMVLSTCVPQRGSEVSTPDGTAIPLIYIFQFAKKDITGPDDCAFIRGSLMSFAELEEYKVFDDGEYVCYEVTDLFYSDLAEHVATLKAGLTDVFIDDGVTARLNSVYAFLKNPDNLGDLFYYSD